ncbi:MAG: translation initiation factor IF-3 [Ruminococcaceae bacterium]|jgi:translation initiation factor IF-3|nr:translation initiation factor IF-3 [Oscillospiraceae bacterium]
MGQYGKRLLKAVVLCIVVRADILPALFIETDNVFWRCLTISNKELQINEEIRDREVRVVGSDGSQLGIMSSAQALEKAFEQNLDLVKIAPQATPPVCKIIDYGKFRFEQAKRDKEAKKNQRIVDIKEIRLSLNIDTHDFNTKVGHATRFLKDGDKVKASIRFRGREMGHPEQGYSIMRNFAEALSEIANVEKPAKLEGRNMLMFLASKPAK